MTAFVDLCREWVLVKARRGQLPMVPEVVGSHWSTDAQVDVVAVNWHDKAILLGEHKWGVDDVARPVILELAEKAPKVIQNEGWQVHYANFARTGFTEAARAVIHPLRFPYQKCFQSPPLVCRAMKV